MVLPHITAQLLMFWEDSLTGKDRLVGGEGQEISRFT